MRPTILLLLLLAATAAPADDGFDELEQLAALWSVADEPFKPVTRELEDPQLPFRIGHRQFHFDPIKMGLRIFQCNLVVDHPLLSPRVTFRQFGPFTEIVPFRKPG